MCQQKFNNFIRVLWNTACRPVANGGRRRSDDPPPGGVKRSLSANCSSANILNIVHLWNRINKVELTYHVDSSFDHKVTSSIVIILKVEVSLRQLLGTPIFKPPCKIWGKRPPPRYHKAGYGHVQFDKSCCCSGRCDEESWVRAELVWRTCWPFWRSRARVRTVRMTWTWRETRGPAEDLLESWRTHCGDVAVDRIRTSSSNNDNKSIQRAKNSTKAKIATETDPGFESELIRIWMSPGSLRKCCGSEFDILQSFLKIGRCLYEKC